MISDEAKEANKAIDKLNEAKQKMIRALINLNNMHVDIRAKNKKLLQTILLGALDDVDIILEKLYGF